MIREHFPASGMTTFQKLVCDIVALEMGVKGSANVEKAIKKAEETILAISNHEDSQSPDVVH